VIRIMADILAADIEEAKTGDDNGRHQPKPTCAAPRAGTPCL
jgi:hypothetical protein